MVAEIRTRRNLTEKANCKQSKISGHAWTDTGLSQKFANGLQNRLSEARILPYISSLKDKVMLMTRKVLIS